MQIYIESRIVSYEREGQAGEEPTPFVFAQSTSTCDLDPSPTLKKLGGVLDVITENSVQLYQEFVARTNEMPRIIEGREMVSVDRNALMALLNAIDASKVKLIRSFATKKDDNGNVWYCLNFTKA